jgi:hypothetical protein
MPTVFGQPARASRPTPTLIDFVRMGVATIQHPEHIYEARKGEKARQIAALDVDNRRTMEAEITNRAVCL